MSQPFTGLSKLSRVVECPDAVVLTTYETDQAAFRLAFRASNFVFF